MENKLRHFLFLMLILSLFACKQNKSTHGRIHTNQVDIEYGINDSQNDDDKSYADGLYHAEVRYYNPKTETISTYALTVEIEDEKLVKIHFKNGGWLDDSHFTPPDISTGTAEFVSDKDYKYEVTILRAE